MLAKVLGLDRPLVASRGYKTVVTTSTQKIKGFYRKIVYNEKITCTDVIRFSIET